MLAVLVVVGLVVKLWLALLALALGGLPTIWSGHAIVVVPRKRKRIRRTRRSGLADPIVCHKGSDCGAQ